MKVESKAQLKSLRMSPRKVRLVVDLIRGLSVDKALAQLVFSKKTAARPIKKLLESAIANAMHNQSMKREGLVIESGFVDEGTAIKRWQPRAFGRANPLRKRSSHITLVLSGMIDAEVLSQKKTAEVKEEKVQETKEETITTKAN